MKHIEVFPDGRVLVGGKRYVCALGKYGVTTNKREGDGATPAGTFRLLSVYYHPKRVERPNTALPVREITPELGWGDDPADPANYNQPLTIPHAFGHEKMWRADHLYDIVVDLDYNRQPAIPGKGSAIFLHLSRDQVDPTKTPTRGCIAFRREDLLEILRKASAESSLIVHG